MMYQLYDLRDFALDDRIKSNHGLEKPFRCSGCNRLRPDLYPQPIDWTVGRAPKYAMNLSGFQLGIWVVRNDLLDVLHKHSDRVVGGAVSVHERGVVRGFSTVYCASRKPIRVRGVPEPKRGDAYFYCNTCRRPWSSWAVFREPLYVLQNEVDSSVKVHGDTGRNIYVTPEVRTEIIDAGITDVGFKPMEIRESAHAPVPEWGES